MSSTINLSSLITDMCLHGATEGELSDAIEATKTLIDFNKKYGSKEDNS